MVPADKKGGIDGLVRDGDANEKQKLNLRGKSKLRHEDRTRLDSTSRRDDKNQESVL